jgi:ligand-binding sensor domain-containing protein
VNCLGILARVSGLASGADGALWLVAARGVLRIDADELDRASVDPSYAVQSRLFDEEDGVPGGGQTTAGITLVNDAQGRLWVAARANHSHSA